jgi:hypothetical protein
LQLQQTADVNATAARPANRPNQEAAMHRTKRGHPAAGPPGVPRTTAGLIIAFLCFALVFPVTAAWAGVNAATVSAVLASLPGILLAALSPHKRQ